MERKKMRLVLPTGRMHRAVLELLREAGLDVPSSEKNYRPAASDPDIEVKLLKPANIPTLIELGAHDVGFTGLDWVRESGAAVDCLLDTGLLPVRLVSAAPAGSNPLTDSLDRPVVVASEYENLTRSYMDPLGIDWRFVRTYGATEVFPPEDADLIVDNTATGSALAANRLEILDEILRSTTQLIVNPRSLDSAVVREKVDDLCLLMRSVLAARQRVLLEMNVPQAQLEHVVALLPAMKAPTVQPLYGNGEFAVKAAVPREQVPRLILRLRRAGASDILETRIRRITS
jgi:ATP phosphoribosyltransferase